MFKMLMKDLAAVACGILFAIVCFSILVHYQLFSKNDRALDYIEDQQRTMNVQRALENP